MARSLIYVSCTDLKTACMLINLDPIVQIFARQKVEKKTLPLTRKDWVNIDRIVMIVLLISVIIGAIIFS